MNILKINIPIGIGDILYAKGMLDAVKHNYNEIHIKFHREIINSYKMSQDYNVFLDELGRLLFSEPPYILTDEPGIPFYGIMELCHDKGISPIKPNLKHILCYGEPLQLDSEYIVIATKARYMPKKHIDPLAMSMWQMVSKLAQKYHIVIVGERELQMNIGYQEIGKDHVYSFYNSIMENVPNDRIIDCSIPVFGKNCPSLTKLKQDCLIMSQSKFTMTLGVGGGLSIASCVSKVIGYRRDSDSIADHVFSHESQDAIITKDWNRFLMALEEQL